MTAREETVVPSPRVDYLCNDPECCSNGCPIVVCRVCGKSWPCADYQSAHTPAQVARQERWVKITCGVRAHDPR